MASPLNDILVESIGKGVSRQSKTNVNADPEMDLRHLGEYKRSSLLRDPGSIYLNSRLLQRLGDINRILRHEQIHALLRDYKFKNEGKPLSEFENAVFGYRMGNPIIESPAYAFSDASKNPLQITPFSTNKIPDVRDYRSTFLSTAPPDVIQQILKLFGRSAAQE